MPTLLLAEWMKTWRHPMHRLLLWMVVGLVGLTILMLTVTTAADPSMKETLGKLIPFPLIAVRLERILQVLAPLIACLVTANLVGNEYGRDTWKMILPRRPGRAGFILAKLVCALAFTLFVLATFFVLAILAARIGTALVELPVTDAAADARFPGASLLVLVLYVAVLVSLTAGLTIATRSVTAGAGAILVWDFLAKTLGDAHRHLAHLLPINHLDNLAALGTDDRAWLDKVQIAFEAEVSAGQSLGVLTAYFLVGLVGALWIFLRRDQAGAPGS